MLYKKILLQVIIVLKICIIIIILGKPMVLEPIPKDYEPPQLSDLGKKLLGIIPYEGEDMSKRQMKLCFE